MEHLDEIRGKEVAQFHSSDVFLCTPAGAFRRGPPGKHTPFLSQVKCYHKKYRSATRDVIFRLQLHTGAVQGQTVFAGLEDLDSASKGEVPPWVQTECRENGPSVGGPLEPYVFLSLFSTTAPTPHHKPAD